MNPWDLSCRNKLPSVDSSSLVDSSPPSNYTSIVNSTTTKVNTFILASYSSDNINKQQVVAASTAANRSNNNQQNINNTILPQHNHSNLPQRFTSQRTPKPSTSNSSFYSLSVSPASSSSRSNSGCESLSDDVQLGKMLTASPCALMNNNSESTCRNVAAREETQAQNQQTSNLLDRKARKKDQNRRAAFNYRRKKMEEKNRMREDEMRLVYSRVCLIGYAEELESSIMYILNTKTKKIFDKDGNANSFLCPVCLHSCDNTMNLRSHLNVIHYPNIIGC